MIGDLPAIGKTAYGSTSSMFSLDNAAALQNMQNAAAGIAAQGLAFDNASAALPAPVAPVGRRRMVLGPIVPLPNQEHKMPAPVRRLVKVIIVDPNENVPLEDCVLYSGDEKMTDATDQELFFEVDIKSILDAHNAKRTKIVDKKVKERTEYLEPVKIRELRMVVVDIATF